MLRFTKPILAVLLLFSFVSVFAQDADKDQKWSIDTVSYEQRAWSSAEGVEMTRDMYLELGAKYQIADSTFLYFRYKTNNYDENTMRKFNTRVNSSFGDTLEAQVDFEINMDADSRGATAIGLDTDSDYTYLKYKVAGLTLGIFPFNFDSEVGDKLATGDVCTIYSVEGAPATALSEATDSQYINRHTIPGLVASYNVMNMLDIYAGAGAVRYYYPDGSFNIESGVGADVWTSKMDIGYKGGVELTMNNVGTHMLLELAGHTEAEETGALLERAIGLTLTQDFQNLIGLGLYIEAEAVYTQAGKKPWNVTGDWFEDTVPYEPIYSDINGKTQSWAGESDLGYMALVGYRIGSVMPFATFRMLGENFIYSDDFHSPESAQNLRTADGSGSHGGLTVIGGGLEITVEDFSFTPLFEYKSAANEVFAKTDDIRSYSSLESRQKTEMVVTLSVEYKPSN